ncbi:MAG: LysM peptidoglycan-binding domain-containing protein [Luteolibacter sp.]
MSLWTLIKILSGIAVLALMAITGTVAWHIAVAPLGGLVAQVVPESRDVLASPPDPKLLDLLDAAAPVDFDPSKKSYEKARELLALGKLDDAKTKLLTITHIYPQSASAVPARRIIGDMNLDKLLSFDHLDGKQIHLVKPGESLLGIASRYQTNIDCIMQLNLMLDLPRLQPGQKLIVMPLNFRIRIEPELDTVSLWDEGNFVCDFKVLRWGQGTRKPRIGKVTAKPAEIDGRRIPPQSTEYRAADKSLVISSPTLQIRAWSENDDDESSIGTILLAKEAMEELALLTRVGNEVEVHTSR